MTTFSMASLSEADYCALEDALLATEKGRRFLRAYVDRNRGLETLRLLRSISRMHRAALGVPGVNAEVCRDLMGDAETCLQAARAGFGMLRRGRPVPMLSPPDLKRSRLALSL